MRGSGGRIERRAPPSVSESDGDRVDEALIVLGVTARGDGGRLAMRLPGEGRRAWVGDPDLNGAETLRAETITVLACPVVR
jgi:hypothetical protein